MSGEVGDVKRLIKRRFFSLLMKTDDVLAHQGGSDGNGKRSA